LRIERPLLRGRLVRRYKRFLADVVLDDGREVTAHCPNSGSMLGLAIPGAAVIVSDSRDPKRKLPLTLERVRAGRTWVGVNTMLPNRIVEEAVAKGRVPAVAGYPEQKREVVLEEGTRIDLRLAGAGRPPCWLEVKSATLRQGEAIRFPDAVTVRGRKHLDALRGAVARGERGVLLFVVNRGDGRYVAPADEIDPAYGDALRRAAAAGVEIIAHRARMRGDRTWLAEAVPVRLR
jgi:sugar fermentation stimulation protein A